MALFIFASFQAQTQLVQPSQQQSDGGAALRFRMLLSRRTAFRLHLASFLVVARGASSSSSSATRPRLSAGRRASGGDHAGSADTKQQQHDKAERELKQEEQQRLLGVVPNFNVVLNGQALPLTGEQKWNLALHGVVDPFYFGWSFVSAEARAS